MSETFPEIADRYYRAHPELTDRELAQLIHRELHVYVPEVVIARARGADVKNIRAYFRAHPSTPPAAASEATGIALDVCEREHAALLAQRQVRKNARPKSEIASEYAARDPEATDEAIADRIFAELGVKLTTACVSRVRRLAGPRPKRETKTSIARDWIVRYPGLGSKEIAERMQADGIEISHATVTAARAMLARGESFDRKEPVSGRLEPELQTLYARMCRMCPHDAARELLASGRVCESITNLCWNYPHRAIVLAKSGQIGTCERCTNHLIGGL